MRQALLLDLDWTVWYHKTCNYGKEMCNALHIPYVQESELEFNKFWSEHDQVWSGQEITTKYIAKLFEDFIPSLSSKGVTGMQMLQVCNQLKNNRLYSDTIPVLQILKKLLIPVFGLTNWFQQAQIEILKELEIFPYFSSVYGFRETGISYAKPDKRLAACLDENISYILCGDSLHTDIAFANKVGIESILLCRDGITRIPSEGPQPNYVVNDLFEALAIIKEKRL